MIKLHLHNFAYDTLFLKCKPLAFTNWWGIFCTIENRNKQFVEVCDFFVNIEDIDDIFNMLLDYNCMLLNVEHAKYGVLCKHIIKNNIKYFATSYKKV